MKFELTTTEIEKIITEHLKKFYSKNFYIENWVHHMKPYGIILNSEEENNNTLDKFIKNVDINIARVKKIKQNKIDDKK